MSKLIYGWGINDADYPTHPSVGGRQVICPYYRIWFGMVHRCYSSKEHIRYPTYKGCKICLEWKYFMTFRAWMIEQEWEGNQLDKDLLGERLYSPETCCFVPGWLNKLFTNSGRSRGRYPIGVCFDRGKYIARVSILGKQKHLGYFNTPEEAHQVYLTAKKKHVTLLMRDYPDLRIKQAVLLKLETL